MNEAKSLLNCYESIAGLTERMLGVARDGDWDALIDLEMQYRAQVDSIKQLDASLPLSEDERARKHAVIRRILADDAAIRDLAHAITASAVAPSPSGTISALTASPHLSSGTPITATSATPGQPAMAFSTSAG